MSGVFLWRRKKRRKRIFLPFRDPMGVWPLCPCSLLCYACFCMPRRRFFVNVSALTVLPPCCIRTVLIRGCAYICTGGGTDLLRIDSTHGRRQLSGQANCFKYQQNPTHMKLCIVLQVNINQMQILYPHATASTIFSELWCSMCIYAAVRSTEDIVWYSTTLVALLAPGRPPKRHVKRHCSSLELFTL